jgi:folylpolyglutamate synthase/dihydropteroate synthase
MIGIPIEIERNGKMEKIYLSTRRSGPIGQGMIEARNQARREKLNSARLAAQLSILSARLEKMPETDAQLQAIGKEVDELIIGVAKAAEAARNAAEQAVRLAVEANHGPDVDAILDCLSDRDIEQMLTALETGAVPEDFFQRRATPPKQSSITPGADGSGVSSSSGASPAQISSPAG